MDQWAPFAPLPLLVLLLVLTVVAAVTPLPSYWCMEPTSLPSQDGLGLRPPLLPPPRAPPPVHRDKNPSGLTTHLEVVHQHLAACAQRPLVHHAPTALQQQQLVKRLGEGARGRVCPGSGEEQRARMST